MAKSFIFWDPSWNAGLHTPTLEGPLEIEIDDQSDNADIERLEAFVSTFTLSSIFTGSYIKYLRSADVISGTGLTDSGLLVSQYQWMPEDLEFFVADPLNGEPLPDDEFDTFAGESWRYMDLGWRMQFRGWIGTMDQGSLGGEFEVFWNDTVVRNAGDTHGGWTGLRMSAQDIAISSGTFRQDWTSFLGHGKRPADTNWSLYGCNVERDPIGPEIATPTSSTQNGISGSGHRLAVSGGPPIWNVQAFNNLGGGFVPWGAPFPVDFRQYGIAGQLDHFALTGSMFAGTADIHPGVLPPSTWPTSQTFFNSVSVSQFEPWMCDRASWGMHEWLEHNGLSNSTPLEIRMPPSDLAHVPLGLTESPDDLRIAHSGGDIGIGLGPNSILFSYGYHDRRLVELDIPHIQAIAPCDTSMFGSSTPFASVVKIVPQNISSWGNHVCILSFGEIMSTSPTVPSNGIGITWEKVSGTEGILKIKYWSGGPGWSELPYSFDLSEYDDEIVEIAFAWSGDAGSGIGRDNSELRLLINGATKASVIDSSISFSGTDHVLIGKSANPATITHECFQGIFLLGASFADAMTDSDIASAFSIVEDEFQNPSFEVEATTGRPGEAEAWDWFSYQQEAEWAEFNAYDAELIAYKIAIEYFFGGWVDGWIENWTLTSLIAALFNAGVPAFEGTQEEFGLWAWPEGAPTFVGPPWKDAWVFTAPWEEIPPTGFDGWYDEIYGTSLYPLHDEGFGEAWGNDPFSTSATGMWHPNTGATGRLYGEILTFPITIPPDMNRIGVLTDFPEVRFMEIASGEYSDMATLVTELNIQLAAVFPASGFIFGYWTDSAGDNGITFGWDGSFPVAGFFAFCSMERQRFDDARRTLGLDSFSPTGQASKIRYPSPLLSVTPSGTQPTDYFLVDGWSLVEIVTATDPYIAGSFVDVYGQIAAIFDTMIPDPTRLERFTLLGWFGPGSVWNAGWYPGDPPIQAMFDSGSVTMEQFYPALWPLEIWT